jgi:hypothetical protein
MASISTGPGGRRTIQFYSGDGKRKSIRLGMVPAKLAEQVKLKVEALSVAAVSGMPIDNDTAQWVAKVGDDLAEKLAAVGLVAARKVATLDAFLRAYIADKTDAKRRTVVNLDACRRRLVEFLGAAVPLREVTEQNAEAWHRWLKTKYQGGTIHRTVGRARQFWKAALRRKLVDENPFLCLKPSAELDTSRRAYIDAATAEKVIDACPPWLALVVALARYAGLRIPSELTNLRWVDVLADRLRIDSPKTGERFFPLTPALRRHLGRAFEIATEGAEFIVEGETRRRGQGETLRKPLLAACRRAGVPAWGKLFTNLRSSCATDLAEEYPAHVAGAWMGHSAAVAAKHYLQVTDEHFGRAAKSGAVEVRNPVPQAAAASRTVHYGTSEAGAACGSTRDGAVQYGEGKHPDQDSNPELLFRRQS